jgi:hypothetical protein
MFAKKNPRNKLGLTTMKDGLEEQKALYSLKTTAGFLRAYILVNLWINYDYDNNGDIETASPPSCIIFHHAKCLVSKSESPNGSAWKEKQPPRVQQKLFYHGKCKITLPAQSINGFSYKVVNQPVYSKYLILFSA